MEGKVKYFLMGLVILLIALMFKDSFAFVEEYIYDNCDHEYHNEKVSNSYTDNNGQYHNASYNAYWTGSSFTHSDPNKHWWFTAGDLIEFGGSYYCMYAGKTMRNFEQEKGWKTHEDTHRGEDNKITTKYWTTNYHWQKGWLNSVIFNETAGCMMYNYKEDPNSETKRGRLGIQGVIWAEGASTRTGYWWWLG